jgi:hypothetical protein
MAGPEVSNLKTGDRYPSSAPLVTRPSNQRVIESSSFIKEKYMSTKPASLKMREKWDEILKRRYNRIEEQVKVYENRLKMQIREEVMGDFQVEAVLQKRDEIKRGRDEQLARLKADFEAQKAKLDRELYDFERKIARAFGPGYCRTEVKLEDEFSSHNQTDPIKAEIERRLEVQNGAIGKIRDRFRDASEEIWLSDAGQDVKLILDSLETEVQDIAQAAIQRAPALPAPESIDVVAEFEIVPSKKKSKRAKKSAKTK